MSPCPSFLQQQQLRANITGASFPSELRNLLQRRLGELEKQLLKKVSNLEEEKSMLSNATAAYRLKTESTLNALVERISELEKGTGKHTHQSRADEGRVKYCFVGIGLEKCMRLGDSQRISGEENGTR